MLACEAAVEWPGGEGTEDGWTSGVKRKKRKRDELWNDDCVTSSDKLWRSDPRGNKVPEW